MGLSVRQIYRLRDRFCAGGALALAHRGRGRASNRKTSPYRKSTILALVKEHYHEFGPTLAAEMLEERHDIYVSCECLRGWMIEAELWKPRKLRKRFHQPRLRREYYGELIQIDGSEHRWFEQLGNKCTLLVCVDDATSALMALKFAPSESTQSYFALLHDYLEAHGRPIAFYSDKHSVFRVNAKNAKGGAGFTQFGRALQELNIDGICADSAPAKGRVERANKTLQDRLVKALRLEGISDIEDANAYLPRFVDHYNAKFAKAPYHNENRHRPLDPSLHDLNDILAIRETRYVGEQLTFSYLRKKYMLKLDELSNGLAGQYVDLYERAGTPLEVRYRGQALAYTVFDKEQRIAPGAIIENKRLSATLIFAKQMQDEMDAPTPKVKTNSERIGYKPNGKTAGRRPSPRRSKATITAAE